MAHMITHRKMTDITIVIITDIDMTDEMADITNVTMAYITKCYYYNIYKNDWQNAWHKCYYDWYNNSYNDCNINDWQNDWHNKKCYNNWYNNIL